MAHPDAPFIEVIRPSGTAAKPEARVHLSYEDESLVSFPGRTLWCLGCWCPICEGIVVTRELFWQPLHNMPTCAGGSVRGKHDVTLCVPFPGAKLIRVDGPPGSTPGGSPIRSVGRWI